MSLKIFLIALMLSFLLYVPVNAKPITFNAKEMSLHDTIIMIARIGGLNVSVDDSVKGTITTALENVEPVDALNIIAKTKDLKIIEENGIYILTYKYNTNAMMGVHVLPVKYGDVEKLRKALVLSLDLRKDDDERIRRIIEDDDNKNRNTSYRYMRYYEDDDYSEKIEDNDKRVAVNKDVNALILYGTDSEYQRAKELLKSLDIPLKQISIEAKVLAVNKSAAKDLGIEWKWSEAPQYPDYTPGNTTIYNGNPVITEGHYTRKHNNSGYGIIQFGRNPEGLHYEMYYGAKINALISNGKAKMLSRPNVTTIQGNEAIMSVGDRIPVPRVDISNSVTTTSYTYEESGIILKVTPRINEDGSITAAVYTEVSTPQYVADMGVYRFNKRSADTIVTLKDGEPMIIGGLIGKEEEKNLSKIPFLGDLPILGALFRNHHKSKSESELMIFLTAHVINK